MTPQLAFLLNQCVICLQGNNDHSAELFLKQAIKLAPKNPDVLRFFGIIEAKRQNFDSALVYLQKALKEAPKNVFVNSNLGNVLLELKRYDEALLAYGKAIALDPRYAEAYSNKGNALQGLERYDEALIAYDNAITIDPNYAQAYSNKGNTLHELKRYEEAITCFDKALSLNSDYYEAYCNKGVTFYELLQYDDALLAYDKALSIEPNYAQAYYNKGVALQALKLYKEARACHVRAIDIDPDYADAHLALGILHLRMHDFISGWEEHEWRWEASNSNSIKYPSNKPLWDGKKTDKSILVWPEQGVGDKILYSSMLKEVEHLSPRVIVSIDIRLIPIYKRSFPNIEFLDEKTIVPEDAYDLQIPMGSLMKLLRPRVDSFQEASFPYLIDDQEKTTSIKSSLEQTWAGKSICGISWRSSNRRVGDHKSIPLNKLAPILNLDQFEFINLQYDDVTQDLKGLEDSGVQKIHQIPNIDLHDDLDSALSIIQACDLIVTCSNSVAHMAGALNKKTILILPFEAGKFWYWNEVEGSSLCYSSVEIFSQSKQGDWDDVVGKVKIYMESLSFE